VKIDEFHRTNQFLLSALVARLYRFSFQKFLRSQQNSSSWLWETVPFGASNPANSFFGTDCRLRLPQRLPLLFGRISSFPRRRFPGIPWGLADIRLVKIDLVEDSNHPPAESSETSQSSHKGYSQSLSILVLQASKNPWTYCGYSSSCSMVCKTC